jgi:drug/metabolite transporter (DMT)-like permease
MNSKTDRAKGVFALIVLALLFASIGWFTRYLATGFLLFQQVYLRMFAAFLVGYVVLRKQIDTSKYTKLSVKEWLIIAVRAISYSLFGIVLFSQAVLTTTLSNVSFIGSLPMVAILGVVLMHEKLSFKKLFFIALAFIGVLLISVKDYAHIFYWGRGEVLTLISTVFFSLSYVARKWQSNLLNNQELTVVNFLIAFLVVFIVSILKGDGLPISDWHWGLFFAVVAAGIWNIGNVFLTNYGFQKVETILASNILTLEGVFAAVLGFLFFKEVPSVKELFGGLIIALSVIGMNKLENEK